MKSLKLFLAWFIVSLFLLLSAAPVAYIMYLHWEEVATGAGFIAFFFLVLWSGVYLHDHYNGDGA